MLVVSLEFKYQRKIHLSIKHPREALCTQRTLEALRVLSSVLWRKHRDRQSSYSDPQTLPSLLSFLFLNSPRSSKIQPNLLHNLHHSIPRRLAQYPLLRREGIKSTTHFPRHLRSSCHCEWAMRLGFSFLCLSLDVGRIDSDAMLLFWFCFDSWVIWNSANPLFVLRVLDFDIWTSVGRWGRLKLSQNYSIQSLIYR